MKKNLLTGLTGMFFLLVFKLPVSAQSASGYIQLSGDVISYAKSTSGSTEANSVNPKAVKDLAKSFRNLSGEQWYNVKDGFVAMFSVDAVDHQVSYDKKGNWLFTIRSYRESKLPEDVRHIIKASYYDYNINLVQEIEKPAAAKAYIVQLISKTELIKVKIFDGEMQVLQRFNQSE